MQGRALIFILMWLCSTEFAIAQDEALNNYEALNKLYAAYPSYRDQLGQYAFHQGFSRPVERVATIIHELLHIDSAAHSGFFVDGVYYEPYLRREAWPTLTNSQVGPLLLASEHGLISNVYVRNAPNNHLGNVLDEINAYTHVLPMICRYEPESRPKQISNLLGLLHLTEGYLRTLRIRLPLEYSGLSLNRESRGAFSLIVQRAWTALRNCGVADAAIPSHEGANFLTIEAVR